MADRTQSFNEGYDAGYNFGYAKGKSDREQYETPHILIFGDPVDGFNYRGPFKSAAAAIEYGDRLQEVWWVAELAPPEKPEA